MFEVADSTHMRLTRELVVSVSSILGVTHQIVIGPGYVFDGASIPRFAWSIIGAPFEPDFMVAACVHDRLCEIYSTLDDYEARVIGDAVFFYLLARAGVPRWRRCCMYLAVRLHSWWNYGKATR